MAQLFRYLSERNADLEEFVEKGVGKDVLGLTFSTLNT